MVEIDFSKFITVTGAMKILGVSYKTIHAMCDGRLHATRDPANRRWFVRDEVEALAAVRKRRARTKTKAR